MRNWDRWPRSLLQLPSVPSPGGCLVPRSSCPAPTPSTPRSRHAGHVCRGPSLTSPSCRQHGELPAPKLALRHAQHRWRTQQKAEGISAECSGSPLSAAALALPAPVPWSWASTTELPRAPLVKPISNKTRGTAQSSALLGEKYGFAVHKGKAMSMKTNPSMKSRPALPALLRTPRSHHLPVFGVLLGVFPLPGVVGGGYTATRSKMLSRVLQKEGSVPCRNIFELMFVPSPGSGQNVKACSELEIF